MNVAKSQIIEFANANRFVNADLMGHESIETTRIYLRRTANEQQTIVDKVITW